MNAITTLFFDTDNGFKIIADYLARMRRYLQMNVAMLYVGSVMQRSFDEANRYFDEVLNMDMSRGLHSFVGIPYNEWIDAVTDNVFGCFCGLLIRIKDILYRATDYDKDGIVVICDEKYDSKCIRRYVVEMIKRCVDPNTVIDKEIGEYVIRMSGSASIIFGYYIGNVPEYGKVVIMRVRNDNGVEYHVVSHNNVDEIESMLEIMILKNMV